MLKRLIAWFKNLFVKELDPIELEAKNAEAKARIAKTAEKLKAHVRSQMTDSERRYEWLCSTGYTPRVYDGLPKYLRDSETTMSCFRIMVNKCKNKGSAMRMAGKKVIHLSKRKNKWGIDLLAYS